MCTACAAAPRWRRYIRRCTAPARPARDVLLGLLDVLGRVLATPEQAQAAAGVGSQQELGSDRRHGWHQCAVPTPLYADLGDGAARSAPQATRREHAELAAAEPARERALAGSRPVVCGESRAHGRLVVRRRGVERTATYLIVLWCVLQWEI